MEFVHISDTAMALLKEEAEKTGKSVSDIVTLIVDDWFIRNMHCVPDLRKEQTEMKTYHIKPEFLDLWEGGSTPSEPNRIITEDDVRTLSEEWEMPVEKLLEQLEEI